MRPRRRRRLRKMLARHGFSAAVGGLFLLSMFGFLRARVAKSNKGRAPTQREDERVGARVQSTNPQHAIVALRAPVVCPGPTLVKVPSNTIGRQNLARLGSRTSA